MMRAVLCAHALVGMWLMGSALFLPPTFGGDSGEYLVMTESLLRHASPEIRYADVKGVADATRRLPNTIDFAAVFTGYFPAKDGSLYSHHFWGYSLVAVPARALAPLLGLSPLKGHQVVNALLLLATLTVILRSPALAAKPKAFLYGFTLFSPILPFVLWPHPEVFSYSLVTLGLLWVLEGHRYRPILAAAVAAGQSPNLVWLVLWFWLKGTGSVVGPPGFGLTGTPPGRDRLVRASAATLPALLPAAFFYWHFGTPSLIARSGTNYENLSAWRALELFTDLNLGLLPYLPLTLMLWLVAGLVSLARPRTGAWVEFVLLPAVMAVSCTVTSNWNHGTSGPSRYAVWLLPLLFSSVVGLLQSLSEGTAARGALPGPGASDPGRGGGPVPGCHRPGPGRSARTVRLSGALLCRSVGSRPLPPPLQPQPRDLRRAHDAQQL